MSFISVCFNLPQPGTGGNKASWRSNSRFPLGVSGAASAGESEAKGRSKLALFILRTVLSFLPCDNRH